MMIVSLLLHLSDIMDNQIHQRPIEHHDTLRDVLDLRNRPETRACQAEDDGAQDHRLTAVRAHVAGVFAPAGFLVDHDEKVGEVAEEVEHGGDGL